MVTITGKGDHPMYMILYDIIARVEFAKSSPGSQEFVALPGMERREQTITIGGIEIYQKKEDSF